MNLEIWHAYYEVTSLSEFDSELNLLRLKERLSPGDVCSRSPAAAPWSGDLLQLVPGLPFGGDVGFDAECR